MDSHSSASVEVFLDEYSRDDVIAKYLPNTAGAGIDFAGDVLEDVGLHVTGRPFDVLVALVTFNRDQGARDQALRYAERMAAQYPDDPEAQRLVAQLRARSPR